MALGLCCQYMKRVTSSRGNVREVNAMGEKLLQLGRWRRGEYDEARVVGTYVNNVTNLRDMLHVIHDEGIRCFRISSNILPLADKVPLAWRDRPEVVEPLREAGAYAMARGMRLTTHPGQFAVLSSDNPDVVQNAVTELDIHAWFMDAMGLPRTPFYAINIHGGKRDRPDNLKAGIAQLSESARRRLTLENCETCYSVSELLPVAEATGVPICFDSHHHTFRTGDLSMEDAYAASFCTWPAGVKPLQHLSNTAPEYANGNFRERRKHSDYMHYIPDVQREANDRDEIDIEFEFKKKNWAIHDAVKNHEMRL